jgi:hypothetical protein
VQQQAENRRRMVDSLKLRCLHERPIDMDQLRPIDDADRKLILQLGVHAADRLRPRPIFLASRDLALAYFGATIG